MPHDRLGEQACLVVSLEAGAEITPQEMLDHLAAEGLSKYDMPEFWLALDEMPLMPNGKVQRMEVQRLVGSGEKTPKPISPNKAA